MAADALAVIARRVPKVRVVSARAAALVPSDEVRGNNEEPRLPRLVKVQVGALQRGIYMLSSIVINHRVVVRLRRVAPRDAVGAEEVRAHRALPAVRVL